MWQANENFRRRAWYGSNTARERANQARREDAEYWSGPTYAHGATDHGGWGKKWDREQKDKDDLEEYDQRQRAARREARKEAKRKTQNMNTPPPPQHPFHQSTEDFMAQAERYKGQEEARERTEKEMCEDDSCWGRPPSPQHPDLDWSEKVEKDFQKRFKRAKRQRSDHRNVEREQPEKDLLAELMLLLSKIISIQVDIRKIETEVDQPSKATKVHGSGLTLSLSLLSG